MKPNASAVLRIDRDTREKLAILADGRPMNLIVKRLVNAAMQDREPPR